MTYATITTEQRGEVLLITLNRPERLNAWIPRMADDIAEAIQTANRSPDTGAVVMTGAGRGFCAGADMENTFSTRLAGSDPGESTDEGFGGMSAGLNWVEFCQSSKPLIAAVNGVCVGVGLTQILSFDVILASEAARLGMGFIKVGLVPELASTQILCQRVGPGRARSLAFTGDLWPASQAYEAGLVDHLVPSSASLVDEAVSFASRIAANPGRQVQWTKQLLIADALESDTTEVQRRESELLRECWESDEHKEAVQAFLEKRPPAFPPRPPIDS